MLLFMSKPNQFLIEKLYIKDKNFDNIQKHEKEDILSFIKIFLISKIHMKFINLYKYSLQYL